MGARLIPFVYFLFILLFVFHDVNRYLATTKKKSFLVFSFFLEKENIFRSEGGVGRKGLTPQAPLLSPQGCYGTTPHVGAS